MRKPTAGFTILEMVVVVVAAAIVVSGAMTFYGNYRDRVETAQDETNLKAIQVAAKMFTRINGRLPRTVAALLPTLNNDLTLITCPGDTSPPPAGVSYAIDPDTIADAAADPRGELAWLLDPGNAGAVLAIESDRADGSTTAARHEGGGSMEIEITGTPQEAAPPSGNGDPPK